MQKQMCVLRVVKIRGNGGGLGAEIKRQHSNGTVYVAGNIQSERSHLNKSLIPTQGVGGNAIVDAINKRIEEAGVHRKIKDDAVRGMVVYMTGTHDAMMQLASDGRLDDWAADNIKWLRETFGEKNVVCAEMHLDEYTPHMHAVVVPITEDPRYRKESEGEQKNNVKAGARLSAKHFMTKANLRKWQDTYAEAMSKYGLERGVKGSTARHQTMNEYYRRLREEAIPDAKRINSNLLQSNSALAAQNEELRRQHLELAKKLSIAERTIKGLATMKENLEGQKVTLEGEIGLLRAEVSACKGTIEEAAKAKEKLRSAEDRLHNIETAIEDKAAKMVEAEAKLQSVKDEIAQFNEQFRQLYEEYETLLDQRATQQENYARQLEKFAAQTLLDMSRDTIESVRDSLPEWQRDIIQDSILGQMADKGQELVETACQLYVGILNLDNPSAGGGGGGSDSDLRWDGRNPGEDNESYMQRCLNMASKVVASRGVRRNRRRK